jgi:flagellar protein FlaI
MEKERIGIENQILDKLAGKIFLLQEASQKREIVYQVFLEVYSDRQHSQFLKKSQGMDMESFFNEFFSYGIIEEYLSDPDVEDIMINYLDPIHVHKTRVGMVKTDKRFSSRDEIELFIRKLIIFSGRKNIKSINNVELMQAKGRVNIVYSPFGPQITITRGKERPLSIIHLVKNGTLNSDLAAQFWLYIEGLGVKPGNIIISGGPGTGKTTLLNALFNFIPVDERIVVIEDTLELNTELEDNCSRLESNEEVNLADLVKNSLRMRPDRVIVGEVRGREAQDLMTAMNIGKYCMGTLHASTPRETIMRLENEPMNVPKVLINMVDVFVIMRKYNVNGSIKRIVGELVETAGMEDKMVLLSSLWSFDLSKNKFREPTIGSVYRDKLAEISGRRPGEVLEELKVRSRLINVLLKNGIEDFKSVTEFCRKYAANPKAALTELGLERKELLS